MKILDILAAGPALNSVKFAQNALFGGNNSSITENSESSVYVEKVTISDPLIRELDEFIRYYSSELNAYLERDEQALAYAVVGLAKGMGNSFIPSQLYTAVASYLLSKARAAKNQTQEPEIFLLDVP